MYVYVQVTDMADHISLFMQVGTTYFKSNEADLRKAAVIFMGKFNYFLCIS